VVLVGAESGVPAVELAEAVLVVAQVVAVVVAATESVLCQYGVPSQRAPFYRAPVYRRSVPPAITNSDSSGFPHLDARLSADARSSRFRTSTVLGGALRPCWFQPLLSPRRPRAK
jgi:hypothetical protein